MDELGLFPLNSVAVSVSECSWGAWASCSAHCTWNHHMSLSRHALKLPFDPEQEIQLPLTPPSLFLGPEWLSPSAVNHEPASCAHKSPSLPPSTVILPETKWFFYCRSESDKKLMRAIKQLLASILPDRSKGAFDDRWGDSACAFIITVEHHQPFFWIRHFVRLRGFFWGGCLCSFYKSDQNWTNYQPLWHLILIYLWLIFYAEFWWIYLPPSVSSAVSATPGWLWWTDAAGVKIQSIYNHTHTPDCMCREQPEPRSRLTVVLPN